MDSSLYKVISSGEIDQLKQKIASSSDVGKLLHQRTPLKNTTLHVAVKYNKISCVEEICIRCPSLLTQANMKGDTPLHIASRLGLYNIASFFIQQAKILRKTDTESYGERKEVEVVEEDQQSELHKELRQQQQQQVQQLVRMTSIENDTALHEAVKNHHFEVVKLLTEADPYFEYLPNNAGETPLYLAAEDGLLPYVVRIIQTRKYSGHDQGLHGRTPLHIAVISNSTGISNKKVCVDEICNRCPSLLIQPNSKGDTPLHIAARLGLYDIASLLIDKAKINQEDIENTGEGNHDVGGAVPKQLQRLLRMRNNRRDTALHDAVRNRRLEVVKLLTKADPTFEYLECNNAGETPLYLAAEDGLLDFVDQILQTCPSSAHAGPLGRTALHAAERSKSSDVTKILLDKKPGIIKEEDEYGCTALHYATFSGTAVMVTQLLDIDSSIAYMSNKEGKSALHIAVLSIYDSSTTAIIKELTTRCSDCWELLDNEGQNFIHVAADIGRYEVIEYVLRQQNMMVEYLINQQDNNGNTPLHLASRSLRADVVKILCTDKRVNKTILNKKAFTAMNSVSNDPADQVKDPYSYPAEDSLSYMKKAGARYSW